MTFGHIPSGVCEKGFDIEQLGDDARRRFGVIAGGRDPSDEEVLTQERPAPVSVAMLYIVVPSDAALPLDEDDMREGAADFGDKAYPLKAVKDLQRRVKDLRIRAAEGSLEGQPLMSARSPPDAEELRELMRDLGSFLRQDVLEDEPGFSREQSGINATDGDAAGTAAASGGKEPAYLSAGLGTLPKIEALLNVDDGMCEVDEEFADWLRSVFHPN